MTPKKYIYALCCPFTNEIHYIGQSSLGMTRPLSHLTESHSKKVNQWVHELGLLNTKPTVRILHELKEEENIDELESFWIKFRWSKGDYLLNTALNSPLAVIPLKESLASMNFISTFVKQRRKELKMTQVEFADKTGVGVRFLRELEKGKPNLMTEKINQVLSMFGCELGIKKIDR